MIRLISSKKLKEYKALENAVDYLLEIPKGEKMSIQHKASNVVTFKERFDISPQIVEKFNELSDTLKKGVDVFPFVNDVEVDINQGEL